MSQTRAPRPPRVWVSNPKPTKDEVLRVRAQIEHIMESGLRIDPDTGKPRPRHIVTRFEARFGPERALLFAWQPGISIARNPYIEFTFIARQSGELQLHWEDDQGRTLHDKRSITVE
ncbi:MAG: thiosulfate oxidation carrier complex protein SoxZ [Pseudomonadota bacterium]|nr:thiosulfate oxidation carrier complex protein SoxZ [Pseudomonadota bacterium]